MYRKVLLSGVTAAAIIGAGGTALAVTGSDSPSTPAKSGSSSSSTAKHDHHGKKGKHGHGMLRRIEHGQFVTRGKDGKTVTHDVIRGTVTSVSASSITVQSADKKSETYAVTKDTKVRVRDNGKGADSSISKVAKGDRAMVTGTGTSTYTAVHVVDVKGAKKAK